MPEKLVPNQVNLNNIQDTDTNQQSFLLSPTLRKNLQSMVDNVVDALGCVGAIIATLEPDNSLLIRAYTLYVSSAFIEQMADTFGPNLLSPQMAIKLDDVNHQNNLGIQAIRGLGKHPEKFLTSDRLYDIFRPNIEESVADQAQQLAEIKQVIAVPLFWEDEDEVVGGLFVAAKQDFSLRDIDFLTAFSRQATMAIQMQRRLAEIEALERVILSLQTSIIDETQTLQIIVDAVVQKLGYAGAMVATLEADRALPVRAYCIDISPEILHKLEQKAGLTLLGPKSVVHIGDEKFKNNLAIRAVKGAGGRPKKFVVSNQLHDLLRPIVTKELSDLAQRLIRIKQVIAVPFFLEDEVVGNLFVATRKPRFTNREKELLATFGQQAAVGIRNARLYKKAEERRQIAQMFGKMAFSATANIHALRNHISAFQAYIRVIDLTTELSAEQRQELIEINPNILDHLNKASDILDSLHEPWRQAPDIPTNVNNCLNWAARKVFSKIIIDTEKKEIDTGTGVILHRSLANRLPFVHTSPDMLIEAFKVLIENAVDAIKEHPNGRDIWLESHLGQDNTIEVTIRDSGTGIKPEDLNQIFELGWSNKKGQGMGFGLFWTKDYIEGLGGTINVDSGWGKGTTFFITLPASVASTAKRAR